MAAVGRDGHQSVACCQLRLPECPGTQARECDGVQGPVIWRRGAQVRQISGGRGAAAAAGGAIGDGADLLLQLSTVLLLPG